MSKTLYQAVETLLMRWRDDAGQDRGYREIKAELADELETALIEAQAAAVEGWKAFVDNNMTFFDVDHSQPTDGPNTPALASVSKRIWYHATDDVTSYPFSAVVNAAPAQGDV